MDEMLLTAKECDRDAASPTEQRLPADCTRRLARSASGTTRISSPRTSTGSEPRGRPQQGHYQVPGGGRQGHPTGNLEGRDVGCRVCVMAQCPRTARRRSDTRQWAEYGHWAGGSHRTSTTSGRSRTRPSRGRSTRTTVCRTALGSVDLGRSPGRTRGRPWQRVSGRAREAVKSQCALCVCRGLHWVSARRPRAREFKRCVGEVAWCS